VDRFLAFWPDRVQPVMSRQPGLIDGIIHRGIDSDGPFPFINVARWESAEQLKNALGNTAEIMHRDGVELAGVFQELGVRVSQNNYIEAVRYSAELRK
jgi:hypothetical protein